MIIPKEITINSDNNKHIASFKYHDGIRYINKKGLEQTTSFKEVFEGTRFIVCCGDVMVNIEPTDYPEIKRRII